MRLLRKLLVCGVLLVSAASASAQVAVKTNLLGWATTTVNAGLEAGLSRHSTVFVTGYLNPWNFARDRHFRFWNVQPEYRYWFCQKFNGHFLGVHALGGQYNARKINFPLRGLTWGGTYEENDYFPAGDHKGGWPDLEGKNSGRHAEGWFIGAGVTYGYQWMLSRHWNLEASLGAGYVYSPLKYYGRCERCVDRRRLNYVGPTNAQLSFLYVF